MSTSVREYAVLYIGNRKTSGSAISGGNAILNTDQHALDGSEHTGQLPADRVSLEDAAALITAIEAESAFQELALKDYGYTAHGATGATETFDALTAWHSATLDANCTVILTGATAGLLASLVLELTQDVTGSRIVTWPGSVVWPGGVAPTLSTEPGAIDILTFFSRDGGTTWYGFPTGSGVASFGTPALVLGTAAADGVATTAVRTDATIVAFDATAPTTSTAGDAATTGAADLAARRDHRHGREALSTSTPLAESGAGVVGTAIKAAREDHVHPAAGSSAADASIWRPLMDGAGSVIVDGATGQAIMAYGPA